MTRRMRPERRWVWWATMTGALFVLSVPALSNWLGFKPWGFLACLVWPATVVVLPFFAGWVRRWVEAPYEAGRCTACGYDLDGLSSRSDCPECGHGAGCDARAESAATSEPP